MLRSIRVQGLVLGLWVGQPKADRDRQGLWGWQMPVQEVAALQQSKTRQREAIATAQSLLAVALAGPEVLRRQDTYLRCPIAEHQHVGALEEHTQVGAASIHITDHRLQRGRQLMPVAGGQHPREGAQGITEEPRGQGRIQPASVGGFRLAFTAGEVVLLAASEEVPAVLDQLQAGEKCRQAGMQRPGE